MQKQIIKTTIGNLKSALQQVLKAVDTKRVTLQFKAGNMFVHACEADAHARALVATTGEVPDSVVPLPGKNLLAIINAYNVDAECTIAHVDRGLRFNFGGAKVTLDRFGEADIQLFEEKVSSFGYLGITKLKASQLTLALTTVERFAARDDTRMYLRGVYLQSIDGKLVLIGDRRFPSCRKRDGHGCG
ncbi:hypothetical protein LP417_35130 (plasmid) [Polaromonas sp. P1-6]|nr:hypothetical protein LP417_35130 [Polaromonas sp. P1-6]